LGVALTQVQDPTLGLVEPHEVHRGPLLELVQVPLDGIMSFQCVDRTTQLGIICKLAKGALKLPWAKSMHMGNYRKSHGTLTTS